MSQKEQPQAMSSSRCSRHKMHSWKRDTAPQCPDVHVERLRIMLENVDPKINVDSVSSKHFKIILKCLGVKRPEEVLRKLDPLRQGVIPFYELCEVIKMKRKEKCSEEDLRQAFCLMDKDAKGFLTLADLRRINEQHEEKMSEEELQEMLDDADIDGLGLVTQENFVKFMLDAQDDAIECNCNKQ